MAVRCAGNSRRASHCISEPPIRPDLFSPPEQGGRASLAHLVTAGGIENSAGDIGKMRWENGRNSFAESRRNLTDTAQRLEFRKWPCYSKKVPRKVRDLISDLRRAGFITVTGGGKGSHRKFVHPAYLGAVTISGREGDDAKSYQEKQVKQAVESVTP